MQDDPNKVFVFGSNLAGRHGRGAAKFAHEMFGAEYGVGEGLTGRAYAIPTKDAKLKTLPLTAIAKSVKVFLTYAERHPGLTFLVTNVGTGLAGYSHAQMAPLFKDAPANCCFSNEWQPFINPRPRSLTLKAAD